MKHYFFGICLTFCGLACSPDVEIAQDKVQATLTAFGQQNTENLAVIHTDLGDMEVRLFDDTPLHRANFVRMTKAGYFEHGIFYRIVENFMVQGGSSDNSKKPIFRIPNEMSAGHLHLRGALAMARYDEGNPNLESSASEFYLVQGRRFVMEDLLLKNSQNHTPEQLHLFETQGGAPSLDGRYTVFGEITKGLEVLDKMADIKVYDGDKPLEKVTFWVEMKAKQ